MSSEPRLRISITQRAISEVVFFVLNICALYLIIRKINKEAIIMDFLVMIALGIGIMGFWIALGLFAISGPKRRELANWFLTALVVVLFVYFMFF